MGRQKDTVTAPQGVKDYLPLNVRNPYPSREITEMNMNWMGQLEAIASEMNSIRPLPDAEMEYSLISDAIVWTDEYPNELAGRSEQFECLKILLRYRTSVLIGSPNETFKPFWDHARELFPNWAGFEPSRVTPSAEKTAFYEKRSEGDLRHLKRLLGHRDGEN